MKKLITVFAVLLVLCLNALPALAVEAPASQDISVAITSPVSISDVPIHNDNIEITVTNNGTTTYKDLSCYLTIVDVGRGQTYPTDEFGENAYQTRKITSLAPGEQTVVVIPVRVMYVGQFRFTASVMDYATNQVYTGNALNVTMTATSNLNKSLVMLVAAIVPIVLAAAAFLLSKGKTKAKE